MAARQYGNEMSSEGNGLGAPFRTWCAYGELCAARKAVRTKENHGMSSSPTQPPGPHTPGRSSAQGPGAA